MKHIPVWLKSLLCIALAVVLLNAATLPALAVVPSSSTLAPYASKTYIVNCNGLNLRYGASTSSGVKTVLGRGTTVTYISDKSGWWYVRAQNGDYGWVDKKYLAPSSTGASTGSYVVTAGKLNVRAYPRTTARRVGKITKGTVISISELNGDWGYSPSAGGWVALEYLSHTTSAVSGRSSVAVAAGGTYRVTASRLNVRSSASVNSSIKGSLASGTSVTVTRVSGSWAYVTYRGGEGWVSTSYLG